MLRNTIKNSKKITQKKSLKKKNTHLLRDQKSGSLELPKSVSRLLKKGKKNYLSFIITKFLDKTKSRAFNHTLQDMYRNHSDCLPFCSKVDIWKYEYKPDNKIISSQKPISTKRQYWKNKYEARIISITLYGNKEIYLDNLITFINSTNIIIKENKIDDPLWGYNSFTFRIYIAQRNPDSPIKSKIINSTSKKFISKLLKLGCEIAYVDNNLEKVQKDATFWRFMIAAEEMKPGEAIRWLIRDADWTASASESLSVGEWIRSKYQYHRPHLIPACLGPLVACHIDGYHDGKGDFQDMKERIENFPYRFTYGDDELFTRDVLWTRMKYIGSVLTHVYPKNYIFYMMNPRDNSCEDRPTQPFCDSIQKLNKFKKNKSFSNELEYKCDEIYMPEKLPFPYMEIATYDMNTVLKNYMLFDRDDPRQLRVIKSFHNQVEPRLSKL